MNNPKVKPRIVQGVLDGHMECEECHGFEFKHRAECSQMRRFPIQGGGFIPWWLAEVAFEYYCSHWPGQSLERLAERGGFGVTELVAYIRWELRCEHGKDCQCSVPCLVCGQERRKCNHHDGDIRKKQEQGFAEDTCQEPSFTSSPLICPGCHGLDPNCEICYGSGRIGGTPL